MRIKKGSGGCRDEEEAKGALRSIRVCAYTDLPLLQGCAEQGTAGRITGWDSLGSLLTWFHPKLDFLSFTFSNFVALLIIYTINI